MKLRTRFWPPISHRWACRCQDGLTKGLAPLSNISANEVNYHIKDYPADPLPLYAQGYSVVSFLVAQGGPQKFVNYLQTGMSSGDWAQATEKYYQYQGLGHLKKNWLAWVADGGGDVSNYAAIPETKDLLVTAASTPLSELTAPTAVTVASASAIERTWVSKELGISGGVRPIRQFQPTNAPRDASTASAKTIIR
jgi:hypothetical protein